MARIPTKALALGIIAVALIAVVATGFVLTRGRGAQVAQGAAAPISSEIEARYGVRVTQIGVTADGGLVDFRYIVLDPDKAIGLQGDSSRLPVLLAESNGALINSAAAMTVKHDMNQGQTYFLLYRNTDGVIKPGSPVTVKFGDLLLEHVIAK